MRALLFCLTFLFASACNSSPELVEKPDNLLSEQQMVSFLIDMHLLEAKMSYIGTRDPDSLNLLFNNYEHHLMEKHGIDETTYQQSYAYYLDHMGQLKEIYDAVVDSISVLNSLEKKQDTTSTDAL